MSVLELSQAFPRRALSRGETLIEESVRTDRLYVLVRGAFEVVRGGVAVIRIAQPGAFLGEISAVLECAPSATLVPAEDSEVVVIERASSVVRARPELTLAVAQVLARRLVALTGYLVDLKRQYAGTGTHLELMDRVLAELATSSDEMIELGSERTDVPEY